MHQNKIFFLTAKLILVISLKTERILLEDDKKQDFMQYYYQMKWREGDQYTQTKKEKEN
jgi:hypothetical protein